MSGVILKLDSKPAMKFLKSDSFRLFGAHEWKRLVDDYVPMNTGQLAEVNVSYRPGEIEYFAPYAVPVYNGGRSGHAVFKKDMHSKASKEWDLAAKRDGKDKELADVLQGYIDNNL